MQPHIQIVTYITGAGDPFSADCIDTVLSTLENQHGGRLVYRCIDGGHEQITWVDDCDCEFMIEVTRSPYYTKPMAANHGYSGPVTLVKGAYTGQQLIITGRQKNALDDFPILGFAEHIQIPYSEEGRAIVMADLQAKAAQSQKKEQVA